MLEQQIVTFKQQMTFDDMFVNDKETEVTCGGGGGSLGSLDRF